MPGALRYLHLSTSSPPSPAIIIVIIMIACVLCAWAGSRHNIRTCELISLSMKKLAKITLRCVFSNSKQQLLLSSLAKQGVNVGSSTRVRQHLEQVVKRIPGGIKLVPDGNGVRLLPHLARQIRPVPCAAVLATMCDESALLSTRKGQNRGHVSLW